MREQRFIGKFHKDWQVLEDYLHYQQASKRQRLKQQLSPPALTDNEFPVYYRRLCNQLALARTRHFSEHLVSKLNRLVISSHQFLYHRRKSNFARFYQFILIDFPVAVRREKTVMLWALAAFLIPALLVFTLIQLIPTAVYSFLEHHTIEEMEVLYTPAANGKLQNFRYAESDIALFGHYIFNNISIALRSFAGGLLLGIGSVVTVAFNGLYMGAIFSHIQNVGYAEQTLYPFVIAHSAFELTGIIISAGAGLKLGLSFLFPGRYRRKVAVARAARELIPIIIGFVLLLLLAAMIEAFWSATQYPNQIKYLVGSVCWLMVVAYLTLVGRAHES